MQKEIVVFNIKFCSRERNYIIENIYFVILLEFREKWTLPKIRMIWWLYVFVNISKKYMATLIGKWFFSDLVWEY